MILRFLSSQSLTVIKPDGSQASRSVNRGMNRQVVHVQYADPDSEYCNVAFDNGDIAFAVDASLFELREGQIDAYVELEVDEEDDNDVVVFDDKDNDEEYEDYDEI